MFSSLPHDAALLAVGEQVAQSARPDAVYVDTSTVSLGASARVAELCQVRGVQYLAHHGVGQQQNGRGRAAHRHGFWPARRV